MNTILFQVFSYINLAISKWCDISDVNIVDVTAI